MAKLGTGLAVTFASGFLAEIIDGTPPEATRESVDTTHMLTTTARTFTPSDLIDWGEASFDIAFDPGERPPIDQVAETITLTFRDGETWEFTGFMTGFAPANPLEERCTATCRIKVSGDVTVTNDS